MALKLQVNTGDGWFNLNHRWGDREKAIVDLDQNRQRWQMNYPAFAGAEFRIVDDSNPKQLRVIR